MDNIVRLTPDTIVSLMERLSYADLKHNSVRIMTGTDKHGTFIKYDAGDGCGWTPPLYGMAW
jgi:hypothetical protein